MRAAWGHGEGAWARRGGTGWRWRWVQASRGEGGVVWLAPLAPPLGEGAEGKPAKDVKGGCG